MITYYELLTGKHPFQGSDPRTVFYRITTEDPGADPEHRPGLPGGSRSHRQSHPAQRARTAVPEPSRSAARYRAAPDRTCGRNARQTLLAEANRLYNGGQIDSAQAVLSEAFDLDPGNRGARQLRETIQKQLLRRVIEPKIEALLKKAEGFISRAPFPEAIETFEAALRLDRDNPRSTNI